MEMDYYQAFNIGEIFVGIAVLMLFSVITWLIYQASRSVKTAADLDENYYLLEIIGLEKYAKKKGIDMEMEKIKRDMVRSKSFQNQIRKEIYNDFFEGKKK